MATISDTQQRLATGGRAAQADGFPVALIHGLLPMIWRISLLGWALAFAAVILGHAFPSTGRLLFMDMDYRDRIGQLHMLDIDRGVTHHISTLRTANMVEPMFSPNRDRLAFVWQSFENSRIFTVDINGDNLTNVSKGWLMDSRPVWSADAERIAFISSGRAAVTTLFAMNNDGTDVRQLSNLRAQQQNVAWSPDGGRIAFVAEYLMIIDSYTGEVLGRNHNLNGYGTLAWSPDGRYLGFTAYYNNQFTAFLIDEAGNLLRLTSPDIDVRAINWSPDGKRLAFMAFHEGANADVYVIDVNCAADTPLETACGQNMTRLTNGRAFDWLPSWSPDSRWISYVSYGNGAARIFIVDSTGGEPRYLLTQGTSDYQPLWVKY